MANLTRMAPIMCLSLMTAAATVSVGFAATAWTPDQPNVCNQQPTTVAIMTCLQTRAKVWDGRLNAAYRSLAAMLDAQQSADQLTDLKTAQRLWIKYRDENCRYYGDEQGTIREIDGAECLRRMTQDRAIELQQAGPQ